MCVCVCVCVPARIFSPLILYTTESAAAAAASSSSLALLTNPFLSTSLPLSLKITFSERISGLDENEGRLSADFLALLDGAYVGRTDLAGCMYVDPGMKQRPPGRNYLLLWINGNEEGTSSFGNKTTVTTLIVHSK